MTHNSKSIDQKRESFEVIDHADIKFSVTRFSDSKLRKFLGRKKTQTNGSQLKNPDISGAPYTLRIQYSYTQTQCEDGARDVRVLQLTPVTF